MIHKVYTVRDSKAEVYNQPFFQKTHGEAERTLQRLVTDEKSMIALYPDDYDLYYIGDYDDDEGVLKPLDTPHHIMKAAALKSRLQNQQLGN